MPTPLCLLIVEDVADDAELMVAELRRAGFEPSWQRVETESDYLAQLEGKLELILADYTLPQFTALRALHLLQSGGWDIPLIIVTGSISEEVAVECMKQGAADYLLKDRLARLGPAVTHALQEQKLRTERKQAEAALRNSEERFQIVVRATNDAVWDWDLATNQVWRNQSCQTLFRYAPGEIGEHVSWWEEQIHPEHRQKVIAEIRQAINSGEKLWSQEYRFCRGDGTYAHIFDRGYVVHTEQGEPVRMIGGMMDITDRKQAEAQLQHYAFHDSLTGLPNRALFMDRLGHAAHYCQRHPEALAAVFFLDLDRFKVINDSLGHGVGDQFLVTTAQRLAHCLRSMDTAARFGGDEFAILLEDIQDVSEAIHVAERIQAELSLPFRVGLQELSSTVSIGIALMQSANAAQPEDLLRNADIAMYRAKALGRACYQVFDPGMHDHAMALMRLETDLRQAIERQEFRLHYQPIVCLATSQIVGFEALVRWQHPTRGLVSPAEFIPVAEETGLIVPLGQWVLQAACHQLQKWQLHPLGELPLTLSVNLSGKQFTQADLGEQIQQILQQTDLDASSLRLEITESAFMTADSTATSTLLKLKNLGIRLSIDDFGTGYSSLSRLHCLPINTLKIDRSFVNQIDIETNSSNRMIVQAIVTLAHSLDLDVIAEGVETAAQLTYLKALKCEYAQGYFFARPLEPTAAETLMVSQVKS